MAMEYSRRYCKDCRSINRADRPAPSHALHILLSLITAGTWLVIYAMVLLLRDYWRCSQCGSKKTVHARRAPKEVRHAKAQS